MQPFTDVRLSTNFWLSELIVSQLAVRRDLNNTPSVDQLANLGRLVSLLEQVRYALGSVAVIVSSGYRSPTVNHLVGGVSNSAHLIGCAADFTAPRFGSPRQIVELLMQSEFAFDQLICEGNWVHIAVAPPHLAPRRQTLTAEFNAGGPTTYRYGLA